MERIEAICPYCAKGLFIDSVEDTETLLMITLLNVKRSKSVVCSSCYKVFIANIKSLNSKFIVETEKAKMDINLAEYE